MHNDAVVVPLRRQATPSADASANATGISRPVSGGANPLGAVDPDLADVAAVLDSSTTGKKVEKKKGVDSGELEPHEAIFRGRATEEQEEEHGLSIEEAMRSANVTGRSGSANGLKAGNRKKVRRLNWDSVIVRSK